nr:hypothetical protein [Tanacetum cinerariifolium]
EEKIKEMMQLVPVEDVYVQAIQVKHPIIDWKVHTKGQRSYWQIIRLGVKEYLSIRLATSEKEMELWVEFKRMYEPEPKDQLWTLTPNFMHAPVEWKLYDLSGVHHLTAKDKEIFVLVEKDYPLRKGLALMMINYKLQIENYSQMAEDLIRKKYNIANTPRKQVKVVATARRLEMPLPEVYTAVEEKKKKLPVKDRWQCILILEELLDNYSLSLPVNESFHFDIPSFFRPPAKPPDDNTGILNIKMMGDIFDQKVPIHGLTITRASNQEKSPDLLSHQGLENFQLFAKCPMTICGKNTPILDVSLFHFYLLDQLKYWGNWVKLSDLKQALHGRHPMLIINESFHFDIPSFFRPPTKPPDDNTGILNIKMMGDIFDQKVPIPGLTITRASNQEKSPDLLSHQGLENFQLSAKCPMTICGKNTPILDVPLFHFYLLDQLKYGGIGSSLVT